MLAFSEGLKLGAELWILDSGALNPVSFDVLVGERWLPSKDALNALFSGEPGSGP